MLDIFIFNKSERKAKNAKQIERQRKILRYRHTDRQTDKQTESKTKNVIQIERKRKKIVSGGIPMINVHVEERQR